MERKVISQDLKIAGVWQYYLEKRHGWPSVDSPVSDVRLFGQVVGVFNGARHALNGEEGGQVGGVGWDHDEGEEPPDPAHDARRDGAGCHLRSWAQKHMSRNGTIAQFSGTFSLFKF